MEKMHDSDGAARKRAPRQDGEATRRAVLEAAGKIFAERGYADTTAKEICAAANVNSAAVNYYFGGKESLYHEVLIEAHQQLLSLDDLAEISGLKTGPEEKLRAFFKRLLATASSSSRLWGIKVFLRELTAPSQMVGKVLPAAVLPKAELFRAVIGEIMGVPPESPEVQRGVAFALLPCIGLIMFPEELRTKILPSVSVVDATLADDMVRYALGGLQALRDK